MKFIFSLILIIFLSSAHINAADTNTLKFDNEKINEFSEKESGIREEAAKRAQAEVPKLIKKSLSDHVVSLKYNPYDIKPINHPVDLVIYDGNE